MIQPLSFKGIKNIGYAKLTYTDENTHTKINRNIINMQLNNKNGSKDLAEYKKLIRNFPAYENIINENFLHFEIDTQDNPNIVNLLVEPKLNGVGLPCNKETKPIYNFIESLLQRITRMKKSEFTNDAKFIESEDGDNALLFGDDIVEYLTGERGQPDFFGETTLAEEFDRFYNCEKSANLPEEEIDKAIDSSEKVVDIFYNPSYVRGGAIYLGALTMHKILKNNK